jgi:peroxiredoxin (alkyl hydroperoxide reductase subunit C)
MAALVMQPAPDFTAPAILPDGSLTEEFRLSSLRGRYIVLLFYPLDFSFVCPSEVLAFDRELSEFAERDCEVIGISVDSHHTHLAWRKTPVGSGGIGPIRFPLVSDLDKSIARSYGVLHDEAVALRALFLIDREANVRHAVVNDMALGRSVTETLRMLDALRFHEARGELCPANWNEGEDGVKASLEGASGYLARHFARR